MWFIPGYNKSEDTNIFARKDLVKFLREVYLYVWDFISRHMPYHNNINYEARVSMNVAPFTNIDWL